MALGHPACSRARTTMHDDGCTFATLSTMDCRSPHCGCRAFLAGRWHLDCKCAKFREAVVQNVEIGSAEVRGQLERILAAYEEIDRRFGQAGGVANVLALYEQIRRELARVSYDELDRMTQEIKAVIDALLKMDYELRKVNNLKVAFDAGAGPGSAG